MIRIRAIVPRGFWRCGRRFGPGWEYFPDDAFSEADLDRLKAEPMLVVEQVSDLSAKTKKETSSPSAAEEKAPDGAPKAQPQGERKEGAKGKGGGK